MKVSLSGNCEKIGCMQGNEYTEIYHGESIPINHKLPVSFFSISKKNKAWKYICSIPLYLVKALIDILLMNSECDWIDKFEPCTVSVEEYICNANVETLSLEYNKSKFDYKNKKIIFPEVKINNQKQKIRSNICIENLKETFVNGVIKIVGILIIAFIPLTIIMLNAGKYSVYIFLMNLGIIIAVLLKGVCEYRKYKDIKSILIDQKNESEFNM